MNRLLFKLWWVVAALHAVSLVVNIATGAPTLEHEVMMMLALVLAKLEMIEERQQPWLAAKNAGR